MDAADITVIFVTGCWAVWVLWKAASWTAETITNFIEDRP